MSLYSQIATLYPVDVNASNARKFTVTGEAALKMSATAISLPCRFVPRENLSYQAQQMDLDIGGQLICRAGVGNQTAVDLGGNEVVMRSGSEINLDGESYTVTSASTQKDLRGRPVSIVCNLRGPRRA